MLPIGICKGCNKLSNLFDGLCFNCLPDNIKILMKQEFKRLKRIRIKQQMGIKLDILNKKLQYGKRK